MPLRVNPILLLTLIIIIVLSLGIWASAQMGINPIGGQPAGGSSDLASIAEGQIGKLFMMGRDGPDAFSCVGLMRFVLREGGVDGNAPWVPEEYLARYAAVAPGDERRGDIAIFPGWATMLDGAGNVISANELEGFVTKTPLSAAGIPLGIVRPGAPAQPVTTDPLATGGQTIDPLTGQPVTTDPLAAGQSTDLTVYDPNAAGYYDPYAVPTAYDPNAAGYYNPYADPYAVPTAY